MNSTLPDATLPHQRPVPTRARRRLIVVLAALGYAVVPLSIALQERLHSGDWLWLALALTGMVTASAAAFQLMRPARLGLPEGRDHALDERQWQQLARAHTTAYRILGVLVMLASLYLYAAHRNAGLPVPTGDFAWLTIWVGTLLGVPTLPTAVLAWTEPDPND